MFRDQPALPSRRAVVLLGAAVPLVGCTVLDGEPEAIAPPAPHPDEAVRDSVTAAESELIALYAAAAREHPDLAERLEPFRLRHEEHLATMADTTLPSDPTTPGPTTPGPTTPTPATTGQSTPSPSVPPDPADAIEELRAAETAATEERFADCLDARGLALAAVLASVAAAEAANAELLQQVEP